MGTLPRFEVTANGMLTVFLVFVFMWFLLFITSREREKTRWHLPLFATIVYFLVVSLHELAHASVFMSSGYQVEEFGLKFGSAYVRVLLNDTHPEIILAGYLAGPIATLLVGYVSAGIYHLGKYADFRSVTRVVTIMMVIPLVHVFVQSDILHALKYTEAAFAANWLLAVTSWSALILLTIGLATINFYALSGNKYL